MNEKNSEIVAQLPRYGKVLANPKVPGRADPAVFPRPGLRPTGILYACCEWGPAFVNLSLTLSSVFPLLKDLRRNRLSSRLMPPNPAPTPDKYEEKTRQDAIATACAAAVPARRKR
jgi:hypothetical protein